MMELEEEIETGEEYVDDMPEVWKKKQHRMRVKLLKKSHADDDLSLMF
jgi:hypothetical protein